MAYKPQDQLKNIHKSQNPSTTSTPSRSRSESPNQKSEVVETSLLYPEVVSQPPSPYYTPNSTKVHYLIQILEHISIYSKKPERPEVSEESVTSLLQQTSVLTILQSERLGVTPFEFPILP